MNLKVSLAPSGDVIDLHKEPITVGRKGADIVIEDPACSRRHATFYQGPQGELRLSDLHSTNGTFVGNERVIDKAVAIGSEIKIAGRLITILEYSPSGSYRNVPQPVQEQAQAFTPLAEEYAAGHEPSGEDHEEVTQILGLTQVNQPPPLRQKTLSGIAIPPPIRSKAA